ncbi:O-antigen ligase family protein [Siminovitchia terrae]|uniref:O-antigen ligase family protein n=1 Tax=Siminovitchia terrae TaxID=1914933 RepID=A0A429X2U0_SIMTE|nr:O-antigen ligase family protein [Siminovitchia terrae]RST57688.1 O-antigen ligase family protein [Siminovitchia terrae]
MTRLIKFLLSKEFFFVLFLTSGYFKSSESKIDITFVCLLVTVVLALKDMPNKMEKVTFRLIVVLAFIYALILIGFLYSPSASYAIDKLIKFTVLTIPAFLIGIMILQSEESVKRFLKSIIAVGVTMSVFAIYLFMSNNAGIGFIGLGDGNYLGLGRVTGLTFLILMIWITFSRMPRIKALLTIAVALLVFAALSISGARMPLLAALAVGALIVLRSVRIKNGVVLVSSGFKYLFSLLIVGVAFVSWLFSKGYLDTIIYRVSVLFTEKQGGVSAEGRLDRYNEAYEMFVSSPIFGKGLGSFTIFYNNGVDINDYPHNIFLEFLSELGLVGLIGFLVLIFLCLTPILKSGFKGMKLEQSALLACFLFLLLNANTTGDINDNRMMFAFLAIIFKVGTIKRKEFETVRSVKVPTEQSGGRIKGRQLA